MKKLVLVLVATVGFVSCQQNGGGSVSKEAIKKILKENPDIIQETIEAHPTVVIKALNDAVKLAQKEEAQKREEEEKKKLEESYNNPLVAEIRSDELIRGNKDGVITLVEYSDFECPFCSRGFATVMEFLKKYDGKVRFVYKHLPLNFHPNAMIASRYYEGLRLQDEKMAIKFHDKVYQEHSKIKNGEPFLKKVAKDLGADMDKLAKDVESEAVKNRIEADMAEANKFGFSGTPGFLLNGVPIRGAYPMSHFDSIVEELKSRGKITL